MPRLLQIKSSVAYSDGQSILITLISMTSQFNLSYLIWAQVSILQVIEFNVCMEIYTVPA